jgi:hypothetical protein
MDKTVTFIQKEISGHEPQLGLDTKTDRLTDRQLQHNFDFYTVGIVYYALWEVPTPFLCDNLN